jgi:hypothetical protein
MQPKACTWFEHNEVIMYAMKNDELITYAEYDEWTNYPLFVSEDEYEAGDWFKLTIAWQWAPGFSQEDFTVKVYST